MVAAYCPPPTARLGEHYDWHSLPCACACAMARSWGSSSTMFKSSSFLATDVFGTGRSGTTQGSQRNHRRKQPQEQPPSNGHPTGWGKAPAKAKTGCGSKGNSGCGSVGASAGLGSYVTGISWNGTPPFTKF